MRYALSEDRPSTSSFVSPLQGGGRRFDPYSAHRNTQVKQVFWGELGRREEALHNVRLVNRLGGIRSLDPIAAYTSYSAAWNVKDDPHAREQLLDESWSQDGAFFDEEMPDGLVGRGLPPIQLTRSGRMSDLVRRLMKAPCLPTCNLHHTHDRPSRGFGIPSVVTWRSRPRRRWTSFARHRHKAFHQGR